MPYTAVGQYVKVYFCNHEDDGRKGDVQVSRLWTDQVEEHLIKRVS